MDEKQSFASYLRRLNKIEKKVRSETENGKKVSRMSEGRSASEILLKYYNEAIDSLDEDWLNEEYIIISLRHSILTMGQDPDTATILLNLIGYNNGSAQVSIAIAEFYLRTGNIADTKLCLKRANDRHAKPKALLDAAEKMLNDGAKSLESLIDSRFFYQPPDEPEDDFVMQETTSVMEAAINHMSLLENSTFEESINTPYGDSFKSSPMVTETATRLGHSGQFLQKVKSSSPERRVDSYVVDGIDLFSPGDFTRLGENTSMKRSSPSVKSDVANDTVSSVAALLRNPCVRRTPVARNPLSVLRSEQVSSIRGSANVQNTYQPEVDGQSSASPQAIHSSRHILPIKRVAKGQYLNAPTFQTFKPPSIPFFKSQAKAKLSSNFPYHDSRRESRVSHEPPPHLRDACTPFMKPEPPIQSHSIRDERTTELNNASHGNDPTPEHNTSILPTHSSTEERIFESSSGSKTCPSNSFKDMKESEEPVRDFSSDHSSKQRSIRVNGVTYMIDNVIGKGGSSVVYKATTGDDETVAIKVVSFDQQDEKIIASYKNEIVMLSRLQDTGRVIRLYDYETTSSGMAIVMERAEADFKSVHAHLMKKTERNEVSARGLDGQPSLLPAEQVVKLWREMLKCVEALHQKGVVHLDLKPSNFVLVKGTPKIIDLGISHAIPDDMTSVTLQHSMGTLSYMSPEQLESLTDPKRNEKATKKRIGRSSDVWAMGCILHLLMFGKAPLDGTHILQRMVQLSNDQPIPIPEYPSLPKLKEVLALCLQKNHGQRPSISALLNLLTG